MTLQNPIAWIDVETTGLDEEKHALLEIGIIVTNGDLAEIGRESWLVDCFISRPEELADEYVRKMHEKNGLWDSWYRAKANGLLQERAIACSMIKGWLLSLGLEENQAVVAGSTVGFDRRFIRKHLVNPVGSLDEFFHYRSIDVSTLKEIMRRERPDVFDSRPEGLKNHRVLDDLDDSIAEYKHYLVAISSGA